MPNTDDVKNLAKRVGDVETQVGKNETKLEGHGRELGEVKKSITELDDDMKHHAELTTTKLDDMGIAIGSMDRSQVAMNGKIDQLLEFRKDVRGVTISMAQKLFLFIGAILTLLALAILVAIELSKN